MPKRIHRIAGILSPLLIVTFFTSTVLVELLGSHAAVAQLKALIVTPGLWVLLPCLAATGSSGMFIGKSRKGRLVQGKRRRMPFIAANGLLVLVPCAIFLSEWAAVGTFDSRFYLAQALELLAGATNVTLLSLNIRDGLRLAGRLGAPEPSAVRHS